MKSKIKRIKKEESETEGEELNVENIKAFSFKWQKKCSNLGEEKGKNRYRNERKS